MKILLTGITGNLGFEVAHTLKAQGVDVIPVVRDQTDSRLAVFNFENTIEVDLINVDPTLLTERVDCIIHCAGNVNFKSTQEDNSKMMRAVVAVAEKVGVPIFYASTAFLYRQGNEDENARNLYENDKYHSETILRKSSVPHTIFRPSILVGNSKTGAIQNFSGYYLILEIFLKAARMAEAQSRKIRFPSLPGTSNIVPVDQAAKTLVKVVLEQSLSKMIYITNPTPPQASWVLSESLKFFGIDSYVDTIECSYEEYDKLDKTEEEEMLCTLGKHMNPYWSLTYNFPESACGDNLITEEYIQNALRYYSRETNSTKT
jgi:nucleoside-diphosphate-sugar epimerase